MAVRQQLTRERGRALPRFHNLLDGAVVGISFGDAVQQDMAVTVDDGEQVVEVVRDPTGQHADRFHFGRLPELFFEQLTLGNILEHGEDGLPAPVRNRVRSDFHVYHAAIFEAVTPLAGQSQPTRLDNRIL
jgi:hypothetical protein